MNGEREVCANPECDHEKDSHYARATLRPANDGTGLDKIVRVYGACSVLWCTCKRFEKER